MTVRDLAALPKAHLHVHLEGAMRPATMAELAETAGVPTPAVREYRSFAEFTLRYQAASWLIRSAPDLRRVVREVIEDAAVDGAVWVEPHFYPPRYAAGLLSPSLGSEAEVLELVLDEAKSTAARLGIGAGVLVSTLRHRDPAEAVCGWPGWRPATPVTRAWCPSGWPPTSRCSGRNRSPEAFHGWPGKPVWISALRIARRAGAGPGERARCAGRPRSPGPDPCHGVRAVEDPALVDRLATDAVVLDVCPTSNVLLEVVKARSRRTCWPWAAGRRGAVQTLQQGTTRCCSALVCSARSSWPAPRWAWPTNSWPRWPAHRSRPPAPRPNCRRPGSPGWTPG